MQPNWTHPLPSRPRGLSLAREKGWLLAWDENSWLYLLNGDGLRQAQRSLANPVAAAACADDGSACVAASGSEFYWLAPDLTTRWQASIPAAALAVALDPFGRYAAVSDVAGGLRVFNRIGTTVCNICCPRPLHHLIFAPTTPRLFASADYGLVGAFDLVGRPLWRDGLVAHVGSLAVTADGTLLLACFSEGLYRYGPDGRKLDQVVPGEAARLVSANFAGTRILIGGLKNRVILLDAQGRDLAAQELETPVVCLALGPLGDYAVVARKDGPIIEYRTSEPAV
jgi:hypothetical protein